MPFSLSAGRSIIHRLNATACTLSSRPPACPVVFWLDEGRMKGLAFAYDPSGYWIELVKRNKEAKHPEEFNLGQTMLRVKDVDKSLEFYTGERGMGMTKASGVREQGLWPEFDATISPVLFPSGRYVQRAFVFSDKIKRKFQCALLRFICQGLSQAVTS